MSSIEFLLAKLTAQSPGMEMRVQGSTPEFSAAFIAQAVGKITDWRVYHTAMSKFCDDPVSIDEMNFFMEEWAWVHAGRKYPAKSFVRNHTAKASELAVLFFLNPVHEINRTDKSCAAFMEIQMPEWQSKYSNIRNMAVHELSELQSAGSYQMRMILKDE